MTKKRKMAGSSELRAMDMQLNKEEFKKLLVQGLKISHGVGLSPGDMDLVPSAPVAFVSVLDEESVITLSPTVKSSYSFSAPALIPVQMMAFSMYVLPYNHTDTTYVKAEGRWDLQCIKPDHSCDVWLALPIRQPTPVAIRAVHVHVHSGGSSQKINNVKVPHRPMFEDIYMIRVPQVVGGVEISINTHYVLRSKPFDKRRKIVGFTMPLRFPFYSSDFVSKTSKKEKEEDIEVQFSAEPGEEITNFNCSRSLQISSQDKKNVHLVRKLRGLDIRWSNEDLICDAIFAIEEARSQHHDASPGKKRRV